MQFNSFSKLILPGRTWALTAATVLLALCAGSATAQAPDSPPPGPPPSQASSGSPRIPGPERELTRLTRVLSLTAYQQTGVKAVLEQQSNQMKALRAQSRDAAPDSETPESRMAKVKQIRDESYTKIAALLDDNQKKIFADWRAKREAAMERRRGGGDEPPPPPPDAGGNPGGPPQQ